MHAHNSTRWAQRLLVALVALATCSGLGGAADPKDKGDAPKPLPADVVKAWKDAGANLIWLRPAWLHGFEERWDFFERDKRDPGDLPGFGIELKEALLAKLPAPDTAFALYVNAPNDAALKGLGSRACRPWCYPVSPRSPTAA
jgi:hypothetical protein